MGWVEIAVLALSFACGFLGGAVRALVLHRKTLGLEYRVQDLESRNLTVVNREKSQKRWAKQEAVDSEEEAFLASLPRANASGSARFANDGPPSYAP